MLMGAIGLLLGLPNVALAHGQGIAVPTFAKDNFALTAEERSLTSAEVRANLDRALKKGY